MWVRNSIYHLAIGLGLRRWTFSLSCRCSKPTPCIECISISGQYSEINWQFLDQYAVFTPPIGKAQQMKEIDEFSLLAW
jgi:hypothetical protein